MPLRPFAFCRLLFSNDMLDAVHARSSNHYHARLNGLRKNHSLNALACFDPVDPVPLDVITVNTTQDHTTLLNARLSELIF